MQTSTAWQLLKQRTLSVEAIRQIDRTAIERYHMHSLVLMENAAINCTQWIIANWRQLHRAAPPPTPENIAKPTAVILCGRGNNGGDGLAITRHLRLAGWHCSVFLLGPIDRLSKDALANWQVLVAKSLTSESVQSADWNHANFLLAESYPANSSIDKITAALAQCDVIVDAMLGSGAQGAVRAPLDQWIEAANRATAVRIAIDIPTGLDATIGAASEPTFQADATLTFVARKPGFDLPSARAALGHVEVLPIGIPVEFVQELLNVERNRG